MFNQPTSITRRLGHYLLATPLLVLAFSYSQAHAQVVPTPAPAQKPMPKNMAYYVDGQKSGSDALAKITPSDIGSINIIKGAAQQQLFGSANPDGTMLITTKANENSAAVLAFNNRVNAVKPLTPATPAQNAAVAAIQAYLTKTYPSAKLSMVGPARDKADRYQAIFEDGGKRLQLFFDGQGQPVKE
ncbi:MAG: hypothetical protein ACRYF0_13840 [Janthinobacterium lividum]